jgi:hypothetical protein
MAGTYRGTQDRREGGWRSRRSVVAGDSREVQNKQAISTCGRRLDVLRTEREKAYRHGQTLAPGHSEYINGEWGWHGYPRGLGTRLSDMGMSATNIQSILRHANIATTLGHYVFPNADKTKAGLKKLAEAVRKAYKVKV